MRILHTSDWHLGRQFHNVSLLDDQRYVLDQIVAIIRDRKVDVVLVAGDVYDRSVPPAAAVELLDEIIHRICAELRVPMILLAGNHDGPRRLGFAARQLAGAGLHVAGPLWSVPRPILLKDTSCEVAFYPIPYADPATVREVHGVEAADHDAALAYLLGRVREDNGPTRPCVVLAHCFLAGSEPSESERPLSLGGADAVSPEHFKDFSYAALGHLHGPQWRGAEHIRYSGSPLKYSFSEERQRKTLTLVELDGNGKAAIELIPLTPRHDMRSLEGNLADLLAAGKNNPRREDYLLVRLTDRHAILDPMGKLREVYPNVLHLERPGLMAGAERVQIGRDRLKQGELAMFEDFFEQVTGDQPSAEQRLVVADALDRLHREEF